MKLKDYAKTRDFGELPPGLPEGDTYVNLNEIEFQDYEVLEKDGSKTTKTKATINGKEVYIPVTVFRTLVNILKAGGIEARITRTGTLKENTKYTTVKTK